MNFLDIADMATFQTTDFSKLKFPKEASTDEYRAVGEIVEVYGCCARLAKLIKIAILTIFQIPFLLCSQSLRETVIEDWSCLFYGEISKTVRVHSSIFSLCKIAHQICHFQEVETKPEEAISGTIEAIFAAVLSKFILEDRCVDPVFLKQKRGVKDILSIHYPHQLESVEDGNDLEDYEGLARIVAVSFLLNEEPLTKDDVGLATDENGYIHCVKKHQKERLYEEQALHTYIEKINEGILEELQLKEDSVRTELSNITSCSFEPVYEICKTMLRGLAETQGLEVAQKWLSKRITKVKTELESHVPAA